MALKWEEVYIFISSTFDDMHSERDYLVKQVFPELTAWGEKRRLRIVDIDLRWGVTEQESIENRNAVRVCLDHIDKCRPFFLGFLGQRRGWVPESEEVSEDTVREFPELTGYIGNYSVTEMEIMHAVMRPFKKQSSTEKGLSIQDPVPSRHAIFFVRDASYLDALPNYPQRLIEIYSGGRADKREESMEYTDRLGSRLKDSLPAQGCPVFTYTSRWDAGQRTPELALPLICPSARSGMAARWRRQWESAGFHIADDGTEIGYADINAAKQYNDRLCTGRLTDFSCEGRPLKEIILEQLKAAIEEQYPDHKETRPDTVLQKELEEQENFLFSCSYGFIPRGDDFNNLDDYVSGNSDKLFVLTAQGGMGKSMLLSNWIMHCRERKADTGARIFYRFIGASSGSTSIGSLLSGIVEEICETVGGIGSEIPDDPEVLKKKLPDILKAIGSRGRTILVIDALDQLDTGVSDIDWLPRRLPAGIKLVVSFRTGRNDTDSLLTAMKTEGWPVFSEVRPFNERSDRVRLVKTYLSKYLKTLDDIYQDILVDSPGARNPLYLKVVLSELRVFGSFSGLLQKIRSEFGDTPAEAFQGVLGRLESDPSYCGLAPSGAVPVIFGLLANSRHGLAAEELEFMLARVFGCNSSGTGNPGIGGSSNSGRSISPSSISASSNNCSFIREAIYLFMRQMRPFLARREGRYDFFYESFRQAALERYSGDKASLNLQLADCFRAAADPDVSGSWEGSSGRALTELPYHLWKAGCYDRLEVLLSDLAYLEARCSLRNVYELLRDFDFTGFDKGGLALKYRDFIFKKAQSIGRYGNVFFSMIMHNGFEEAKNEADRLLKAGIYKKPWIRTSEIRLPLPDINADAGKYEIDLTGFEFTASCAADNALNAGVAFFVKKVGQVGLIDTTRMELLNGVITTRAIRPLVMFSSNNAKYLALAFDNGYFEVLELTYDNNKFSYSMPVLYLPYLLPEFENPVMLWQEDCLWYQKDESTLVKMSFGNGAPKEEEFGLPVELCGELGSAAVCDDLFVFSMRQAEGCILAIIRDGGILPAGGRNNADAAAMCLLSGQKAERKMSEQKAAVAYNDGTVAVYTLSGGTEADEGISVPGKQICVPGKKIRLPESVKVMCEYRNRLVCITERLSLYVWDYNLADSANEVCGDGSMFARTVRSRPLSLLPKPGDILMLMTESSINCIRFVNGTTGAGNIIEAVFKSTEGAVRSVLKRGNELWLVSDDRPDEHCLATQASAPFRFAADGNDNIIGVSPSGGCVVYDNAESTVYHYDSLPGTASFAAGNSNGGFWLCDRSGLVYSLKNDDFYPVIDLRHVMPSGISMKSWEGLLVWQCTASGADDEGSDADSLLVFYDSRGVDTRPGFIGMRIFKKAGGSLQSYTYSAGSRTVYAVMAGQEKGDVFVRYGNPEDFTANMEETVQVKGARFIVAAVEYDNHGDLLYLLNGQGDIIAVSTKNFNMLAALSPDEPFTVLTQGSFHTNGILLAEGRKRIYESRMEGPICR